MLKGILLDKDGTLIDFDATWGPAAYEAMTILAGGDRARLETLMRISHFIEAERRFLPSSPLLAGSSSHYGPAWASALDREPGPSFFALLDDIFLQAGLKTLTPIGEPEAVCATLAARGLALGIATNDAERSARMQAEVLGLSPHLSFVAGYDSGHGPKPGPGMVLAFAEHLGCRPEEVALVGDTLHDMHAARSAGALAVAVLTGPLGEAARAELAPHADHVIASIADLAALLDGMTGLPARAATA